MSKTSGVEICISVANWDKQSTWKALAKKLKIKSWLQALIVLQEEKE